MKKSTTFLLIILGLALASCHRPNCREKSSISNAKELYQYLRSTAPSLISRKSAAANSGAFAFGNSGVQYGPIQHFDQVKAGGRDVYTIGFHADEMAYILVQGDGDTDLDLYVYDDNGCLIESDTDETDVCECYFTPVRDGFFEIHIVNRGKVYNNYVLQTN